MSKYRIEISPSALKPKLICAAYIGLIASTFLWQATAFNALQNVLQVLVCTCLIVFAYRQVKHCLAVRDLAWMVSDEGACAVLGINSELQYTFTHRSCFYSSFICLQRQEKISGKYEYVWLLRDQISPESFRTLCRIITFMRQATDK